MTGRRQRFIGEALNTPFIILFQPEHRHSKKYLNEEMARNKIIVKEEEANWRETSMDAFVRIIEYEEPPPSPEKPAVILCVNICRFQNNCHRRMKGICSFAHCVEELDVRKCKANTRCRRGPECKFKHSSESVNQFYARQLDLLQQNGGGGGGGGGGRIRENHHRNNTKPHPL